MKLLLPYDIQLATHRNAVPNLIPKIKPDEAWLLNLHNPNLHEELTQKYGFRLAKIVFRWANFLEKYHYTYPKFVRKSAQSILKMARNDAFFKSQTLQTFQKTKYFIKALFQSKTNLNLLAVNPIKKTCPIHLLWRLALIVGIYTKGVFPKDFFVLLEQQFSSTNVLLLLKQLPLASKEKLLLEMYLQQPTFY